MTRLPGAELINRGLIDLHHECESIESLLVEIGAPRLRGLGVQVPSGTARPEARLYALLTRQGPDAHSRYNALVRRLVSYEHALEHASGRQARQSK
jgi:hypothetical protein